MSFFGDIFGPIMAPFTEIAKLPGQVVGGISSTIGGVANAASGAAVGVSGNWSGAARGAVGDVAGAAGGALEGVASSLAMPLALAGGAVLIFMLMNNSK